MRSRSPRGRSALRLPLLLIVLLLAGAAPARAWVFCNAAGVDPRVEVQPTKAAPWGAIGFLDNGCTATLIYESYVLTAGHCLTNTDDGSWQGVYFVPGYHPSQAATFVKVDRAVVGTRIDDGQRDWAIGHLASPVAGRPLLKLDEPPPTPFAVANAGYGRDLNRNKPLPRPPSRPKCLNAYCKIECTAAPCTGLANKTNVWWSAALGTRTCSIGKENAGTVFTDCPVVGGNSGSPLVRAVVRPGARTADYRIVGVIHGGTGPPKGKSYQDITVSPKCKTPPADGLNFGPSARQFHYAPLMATGVGVAPAASGSSHSRVFTADSDASRIVVRSRSGASITSAFTPFSFFGFLLEPKRLAALTQQGGNPGIAAIAKNDRLFVQLASNAEDWTNWQEVKPPSATAGFLDVDAPDGPFGELYALTTAGAPVRSTLQGMAFGAWSSLGGGPYKSISTARNAEGLRFAFGLTSAGKVEAQVQNGKAWSNPFKSPVALPALATPIADFDASSDALGRISLYAVDGKGGLWRTTTRTAYTTPEGSGNVKWEPWSAWDVRLYAPNTAFKEKASVTAQKYGFWTDTAGPKLDGIVSLTATRWAEKAVTGVGNTVVFAIDRQGNVYETGPRCAVANGKCATNYWAGWRASAG